MCDAHGCFVELLFDSKSKSWISKEDFAIVMMHELEHPKHCRQRFAVAY
jgi:putative NADH-flavin reductase